MTAQGARLPYPGLRSFTREETDLFFGREGSVDAMVDRLAATRFLAVLGASGSGKSSLVRTGLLDALELGLLAAAGSRWMIADFRPGDAPLAGMAEGLARAANPGQPTDDDETKLLRAFLARGPRSVVEWCADNLPEGSNLLLLVDQFEELFRYSDYGEREEAEAFVALLLESARAPLREARIYVAITMRSEYLGAAALIDGLAEAINKGLYLTPRMSREEVRQAIVGPAAVCGFSLEPALVNRLLNDLASFAPWDEDRAGNQLQRLIRRADQLPLMQHMLNRLWSLAAARAGGPVILALDDYEALGGLNGALAAHGREILDALLPEHREVAATVFRALTAGSSLAEAVRRPTEFRELLDIAGDEVGVREVVEAFRAPGRNFLVPPWPTRLRPETVIDISHESLIRQWDQFAAWLQKEIASTAAWRRLVDASERHERGEANLLSGLALASLANWWETERPTAAWAKRYGGDFDKAAAFLDASRDEESRGRRARWRARATTAATLLVVLVVIPAGIYLWYQWKAADLARAQAELARAQAVEFAAAADAAKVQAETERQKAVEAASLAEQEKQRADAERRKAVDAAAAAEAEKVKAGEERQRALAAAGAAAAARADAEIERQKAVDSAKLADAAAVVARAAAAAALVAKQAAEQAKLEQQSVMQQVQLAQIADQAGTFQQSLSWESASNLLAKLWMELIEPGTEVRESLLIPQVQAAIGRQTMAEYGVFPGFLNYGGLEGWTGNTGRFRVYSVTPTGGDQSAKRIVIYDVVSGAAIASFPLPVGKELGSKLELVTPDGSRAAIVTSAKDLVLWANDQPAPVLIPVPVSDGNAADVSQLAPVSTDRRFALLLKRDERPSEVIVVDPAAPAISFTVAIAQIEAAAGFDRITSVQLLGLSGDRLLLVVKAAEKYRIVAVDMPAGGIREIALDGIVNDAQLTPDGRILLALTCAKAGCDVQQLAGIDASTGARRWVEPVPRSMLFMEAAARGTGPHGTAPYQTAVENSGEALIFDFVDGAPTARRDARLSPWIGRQTFTGTGVYLTVESGSSGNQQADASDSDQQGVSEDVLTRFVIPQARQRLDLYVAPNSIAVLQEADTTRVAGVSYEGDLLAYRRAGTASFEKDPLFPSIRLGKSNCIAAIAFGGDGRSLLVRRTDGALRYVTAAGRGPGTGWVRPALAAGPDGQIALEPANDAIQCPGSSADKKPVAKIVPADQAGRAFAVLDEQQDLWWVRIGDAGEASPSRQEGAASGPGDGQVSHAMEPLRPLRKRVTSVASDPADGRIAVLSQSAVEILSTNADPNRGSRLSVRSEPKAAIFHADGTLAVLSAGGRLEWFRNQNGAWSVVRSAGIPGSNARQLIASDNQIGMLDERDVVVMVNRFGDDSFTAASRLPANPSAVALLPDGQLLSLEYYTDSASIVQLARMPAESEIAAAAHLIVMRSRMDRVDDSSISVLADVGDAERAEAATASGASECPVQAALYVSRLEDRILGEGSTDAPVGAPPGCIGDTASARLLVAAGALAARAGDAEIREILGDPNLSTVLQAAASDDPIALRVLGAVMAHVAAERGKADEAAIAADAMRFGTGVSPGFLRKVAAGAAIEPAMLAAAGQRLGSDPTAHQLLAHWRERQIDDIDGLSEALYEFSIAERLYRQSGRLVDAEFCGHRRAQLARILPDDKVLDIWQRLHVWQPQVAPAELVGRSTGIQPVAAGVADEASSVARLAELVPNSLLLDVLRVELQRAEILRIANSDPDAVDRLLELGRQAGDESGWSPELIEEYLELAGDLRGKGDSAKAFQLSAEAVRIIAGKFSGPIHANGQASDLFRRAADVFASAAASAPPDLVKAKVANLDFPLAKYDYGTLPATTAAAEVSAAENVLDSVSRLAEVLAAAGDAERWEGTRGEALFWEGVLENDHDTAKAAALLRAAAEAMRGVVAKRPDDLSARFRYAEALRWVGLAAPSTPETADTEREAIRQYAELWRNRTALEEGMRTKVGSGYGFSLANLSRTIREAKLANLRDVGGADEHAAWVLELLALAADRDDLNAELIATGAGASDFDFVNGWYRMSTYGWALGFLGGLVNVESGNAVATQCDLLAADPYDPKRRAPGLGLDQVDLARAEAACREAREANPQDVRATYQLARVIYSDAKRDAEFLPLAKAAADQGVAEAYSLIASTLDAKKDARGRRAYQAAAQRSVIESFPILYPFLAKRASGDRDRRGLAWYAENAAALGVPEAHLVLAEASRDPVVRRVHLGIASRLWMQAGDWVAAQTVLNQAAAATLTAEQSVEAEARVGAWVPETLITLPDDIGSS